MKRITLVLFFLIFPFFAVYAADSNSVGSDSDRTEYGTITRMTLQSAKKSSPLNLGSVLGGVAGGIIGHQFGGGSGKTALTVAGAVGGAIAGNEIHKTTEKDRYKITVRLESGKNVTVNQVGSEGHFRVGDRVRIVGKKLYHE